MDVLAEGRQLRVRADHVLAHVLGVRARVADALDALDRVDQAEQLGEGRLAVLRQVAAVRVHVLPEQGHLPHGVSGEALDLGDQLLGGPTDLAPARGGHDAVGAAAIAADRDLHPGLELALAVRGQMSRETLELEKPLRREAVAREELGELRHLSGSECDIDERKALEDLVLDRLRPAAAHPDDLLGALGLQALGLPEMADQPVVSRLADGARVEEDEVGGLARRRLGVAERLEHALHALRVVLVHLTPEGGDVVRLHDRSKVNRGAPGRSGLRVRRRAPPGPSGPRRASPAS